MVTLRPWREEDIPAIVEACRDPEIGRWTSVPSPYTEEHARDFLENGASGRDDDVQFAIAGADSDQVLGSIGFFAPQEGVGEVGYWVAAPARGRDVAVRAVRLVVRWAFETRQLRRVVTLHCLAAFVFNLGVVAFTINVLGGS